MLAIVARRRTNCRALASASDSYQHSNREFGRVKTPKFELVGWEPKDRFIAALAEAGLVPAEPESLPSTAKDLGDEIPF